MTDHAAAIAILRRLADVELALQGKTPLMSNQGQALDGYSALANFRVVAKTALMLFDVIPTEK